MNIKSRLEKLEASNRDGGMIFISTKGAAEESEAKQKAGTTEKTKYVSNTNAFRIAATPPTIVILSAVFYVANIIFLVIPFPKFWIPSV